MSNVKAIREGMKGASFHPIHCVQVGGGTRGPSVIAIFPCSVISVFSWFTFWLTRQELENLTLIGLSAQSLGAGAVFPFAPRVGSDPTLRIDSIFDSVPASFSAAHALAQ
jgi:hypothetical protein